MFGGGALVIGGSSFCGDSPITDGFERNYADHIAFFLE